MKGWEKLRLTEEEDAVIGGDFEVEDDVGPNSQISLTLVGKLLTKTF